MMKAGRIVSFDAPLSIDTVPEPKIIPKSVILRVSTVYIPTYTNTVVNGSSKVHKLPELPTIPMPIGLGYVEEIGEGVFDIHKGQLVVFGNVISSNDPASKDDGFFLGWAIVGQYGQRLQKVYKEGALAEKVLLPSNAIVPIPEILTKQYSLSQLGILEFIGISYGALVRGDFKPGQVVVINGATGLLGSSAVVLALSMGASRVIAVGRDATALESIRALDPRRVVVVAQSEVADEDAKKIRALAAEADYPKNAGADLFVDIIGKATNDALVLACVKSLKKRGIAVFVGGLSEITIPYTYIMVNQLDIRGSFMYSYDAFGDLIRLVASGVLDLNKFAVHSFPLEQVNEAIAQAAKLKGLNWVMVDMEKK